MLSTEERSALRTLLSQCVTSSAVALQAGVSRPCVTNWRRRDLGFPEPVAEIYGVALFAAAEAHDWLARSGRLGVSDESL